MHIIIRGSKLSKEAVLENCSASGVVIDFSLKASLLQSRFCTQGDELILKVGFSSRRVSEKLELSSLIFVSSLPPVVCRSAHRSEVRRGEGVHADVHVEIIESEGRVVSAREFVEALFVVGEL